MKTSKSILLIEDDKDDQEFFMEAMRANENATVCRVVNNGREALEFLRTASVMPDLIFSDINMPEMDGIECLAAIQNNPFTKNIPVVMLSTSTA
jgi:CheY-like chemotaxis protein